jgi:hypothetical protein
VCIFDAAGERDAVIRYLDQCSAFSEMGRTSLAIWRRKITAGDMPTASSIVTDNRSTWLAKAGTLVFQPPYYRVIARKCHFPALKSVSIKANQL